MAHNKIIPQGDKPGDDPEKYGLKFDGGKARWDLVPMAELLEIITVPGKYLEHGYEDCLLEYNEIDLFNETMNHINMKEDFDLIAFNMFFMLRGRPYTMEELERSVGIYRWDLFDINEIQKVAEVYGYGAKLYAENNWQNVAEPRYYSALIRHFKTVRTKERFDGESGYLHLHHAIWNCMALLWMKNNKKAPKK